MKKIVSLVTVLAVFAMLLVGCAGKFDMDKSIEKLKDKGLTEGNIYTTEAELADATELANSEIKFMGGSFTVEVKGYKQYIQDGDYSKNVQFFTFATVEQATSYAELYISERETDSSWKVGQSECVVIITNLDVAIDVINLEFR